MSATSDDVLQVSDAIDRLRRLNARMGLQLQEQAGVNLTQASALNFIAEGAIRVRDVADALQQHVSTASRLVDWLVGEGLVTRREDPDDRRAVVLELTSAGRATLEDVQAFRHRWIRASLDGLDADERARFADLAQRFAGGAERAFSESEVPAR